jgi:hypothetical protein
MKDPRLETGSQGSPWWRDNAATNFQRIRGAPAFVLQLNTIFGRERYGPEKSAGRHDGSYFLGTSNAHMSKGCCWAVSAGSFSVKVNLTDP